MAEADTKMADTEKIENYTETKAFQMFAQMCWEQHKSRHPAANIDPSRFAEISTGRWKAMTQEQKNAFYYKHECEESNKKKAMKRKGSQEGKTDAKKKSTDIVGESGDAASTPSKPKAKKTAYSFFTSDVKLSFRKENANLTPPEANKELQSKWQNLTDEQKKKYIDLAAQDATRYESEMVKYEELTNSASSKTVYQAVKDPNKPKHSKNAYMFFNATESIIVRKDNPAWGMGEVSKEIGKRWAELPEDQKQKYQDMADKDKVRYEEEMKTYQAPPPVMVAVKDVKDPNKPKGPKSAYTFFGSEVGAEIRADNKGMSLSEVSKEVSKRWKEVDEVTKQRFEALAVSDKNRFEQEMKDYKPPTPKSAKKQKDPNAPRGRMYSYMFFCNEMRPKIWKEQPELKMTELAPKISALWKELGDDQKKKFEEMAEADKKRYESEMELFKEGKFVRTNTEEESLTNGQDESVNEGN